MTRSTRMFEIIQILRAARQPRTAQRLADELEVTKRTVYRDIAALQAMRVPVEGAAGLGYVMRSGYDLPPVNFDVEEAEAVTVGLALIARTGDKGLTRAAKSAAQKLAAATGLSETVYASTWGVEAPTGVDLSQVRQAIREERKMAIAYENGEGEQTQRVIWPIAIAYHSEVNMLAAWCEMRQDLRHFRPDRISAAEVLDARFAGAGDKLRQEWIKGYADRL
ncbi:YafY family transcriptional regulator [Lentibacter algarum]|uniref:helix-turn-helix transcriptional regulator n=1 Tax=Lentibacter algarum TaxID=576131 RepID=UPI001C0A4649|nr:YafY family protein [Lentibacter algarum]MBU2982908.1 YafY family transcriptional regulator [Lentibacter algarum]